ncbi:MAG: phenylalanine--tRNA ligase subunit alpha [Patescibacteria group bacterium]|nr:phenylalanine--tRNA ligase subunit alpha [Patescibacteria group bacterium]
MNNNYMENLLKQIKERLENEIKEIKISEDFERLEKKYFGRKGEFTIAIKSLKDLAEEQRPVIGKLANGVKKEIEELLENAKQKINPIQRKAKEFLFGFDPTLQGSKKELGHLHPCTLVLNEIIDIMSSMGFMVIDGPELESEYYNFEALNIPASHPARDMQDTYFIKTDKNFKYSEKLVLRTQTSALQVRTIEQFGAPLRAIFPGRCFRNEATDASHDNTFYQIEGLMIDKNISIANLVSVMNNILSQIFKREIKTRLRPGYFPFVEPGFELDINCLICGGEGCSVCGDGWLEIMPCGLVNPKVLEYGGLDPKEYSGFAFGIGFTRLVMMLYGINDIRLLQSGDLRFIKQF